MRLPETGLLALATSRAQSHSAPTNNDQGANVTATGVLPLSHRLTFSTLR